MAGGRPLTVYIKSYLQPGIVHPCEVWADETIKELRGKVAGVLGVLGDDITLGYEGCVFTDMAQVIKQTGLVEDGVVEVGQTRQAEARRALSEMGLGWGPDELTSLVDHQCANKAAVVNLILVACPWIDTARGMCYAARSGDIEATRALTPYSDINSKHDGCTPLLLAATMGHADVVAHLLEHGADPNATEDYLDFNMGRTPLHDASSQGHVGVVRYLLAAGADSRAVNKWGETPLHCASWQGHTEVVRHLLSAGAKKNTRDVGGKTPLDYAREKRHLGVMTLLEE